MNDNKKEIIKQITGLLEALITDDPVEEEAPASKPKRKRTTKKKTAKKTAKKKTTNPQESKNKFLNMPEMRMFRDDSLIDKKLQVMPPVPRTRTFDPVHVRCRVCGKEEDVNPTLVSEINRYKCNSCAMAGG